MNRNGSTRVIFLAIFAVLAFAAAVSAFLSWQKEKDKRVSLEAQVDDLQKRKKDLEFTLDASRKESLDLKNKLLASEAELLSLSSQIDSEKSDKERISRELEQIKSDLATANELKAKIELELGQAKKELDEVKTKTSDLAKAKQKLEEKVKELETGATNKVELGKIIITPKKADKFEAQVLTLNKEYNFVVISLGQKDGFKTSDVFFIENASNVSLGKGYVEEAKEAMSVLSFTDKGIVGKLKEGDKIILKLQQ